VTTAEVSAIIAGCALVLSSFNTWILWREHREKRRRHLRVQAKVLITHGNPPQKKGIQIVVANESQAEVQVEDIYARIPSGAVASSLRPLVKGERELPCPLAPEHAVEFYVPWEEFADPAFEPAPDKDGWVRGINWAQDGMENRYVTDVSYREYMPRPKDEDE
jgi:hypothetical protein